MLKIKLDNGTLVRDTALFNTMRWTPQNPTPKLCKKAFQAEVAKARRLSECFSCNIVWQHGRGTANLQECGRNM